MQTHDCLMTVGVMLQDVADSVDLSSHEDNEAEVQASLQVGADARQLIMEAVMHLQVVQTLNLGIAICASLISDAALLVDLKAQQMLRQALILLLHLHGKHS